MTGAPPAADAALVRAVRDIRGYEGLPRLVWVPAGESRPGRAEYRKGTPSAAEAGADVAYPVYDDAAPGNRWMPYSTQDYGSWSRTLKGKPTLGYGTRYDLLSPALRRQYVSSFGAPGADWLEARLREDVRRNFAPVLRRHPGIAGMSEAQRASLMSLYYNLGPSARGKETLERALKAGDIPAIGRAIGLYSRAGGRVLPGLVRRRAAEAAPFLQASPAKPSAAPAQPSPVRAAGPAAGSWHTVGSGDSLWSLWRGRRDRREKWPAFGARVRGLNPGTDLSALRPGQRIRLE